MLIALYVDDMIIAAKDSAAALQIKNEAQHALQDQKLGEESVSLDSKSVAI
eukprot:IDg20450t1